MTADPRPAPPEHAITKPPSHATPITMFERQKWMELSEKDFRGFSSAKEIQFLAQRYEATLQLLEANKSKVASSDRDALARLIRDTTFHLSSGNFDVAGRGFSEIIADAILASGLARTPESASVGDTPSPETNV